MKKLFGLALIFVHSITAMQSFSKKADVIFGGTGIAVYTENGKTYAQIGTTKLSSSNLQQAYQCADYLWRLLEHPDTYDWTRTSIKSAIAKLVHHLPKLNSESACTIQAGLVKSIFQKLQTALKMSFVKKQAKR